MGWAFLSQRPAYQEPGAISVFSGGDCPGTDLGPWATTAYPGLSAPSVRHPNNPIILYGRSCPALPSLAFDARQIDEFGWGGGRKGWAVASVRIVDRTALGAG